MISKAFKISVLLGFCTVLSACAKTEDVAKNAHAVKLRGQDGLNNYFIVNIGEGFTAAMIKDEPADIKHTHKNVYEIRTKEYLVNVFLDDNGVTSAEWRHTTDKDRGNLIIVKGEY